MEELKRYIESWQDEIESAFLYNALADAEEQTPLAEVYRRLAKTEIEHSKFWEAKIIALGQLPPVRIGWRTRFLALLAKKFGAQFVVPTISAMEQVDSHTYDMSPDAQNTVLPVEERSHARLLNAIATDKGLEGGTLASIEGRHRTGGGNSLRAAVLGASDGLLSNLSLVMGVAGADLSTHSVLLTGIAGLLAGACSMALGEWLSVQSSRELYERQISIERREVEEVPDEEEEELALIYEAKGLPPEQAQALAKKMMADRTNALDTLAREELGIDPEELGGSAIGAATTSFFLFTIGAIIPVLPFFFATGQMAVYISLLCSGIGLFAIGAGITLLTGKSILYSGTRQLVFGFAAAGITYGIGKLLGVSLS